MSKTSTQPGEVPLAVWPVAQASAQQQRRDRYVADSSDHPGKMLPALAKRIIEEYSSPGDLVVDPMCGIGTSVVEGAAIGRQYIGIDLEPRWVDVAKANVNHALNAEQRERTDIRVGDVRTLADSLGGDSGNIDLIVTSPPYGCEVAKIDSGSFAAGGNIKNFASQNYSGDKANFGHARGDKYVDALQLIYSQCFDAMRPGGLFVTVTKNMRQKFALVDLAGITVEIAQSLGFRYLQHNIALLCGMQDDRLVGRPSFWQRCSIERAHSVGHPQHLVVHEDVLVFAKPGDVNA
jgi:modification methylase